MAENFTKEQIFDELKKILVEELEINDGDIVPERLRHLSECLL